jgi:hypothetical protein
MDNNPLKEMLVAEAFLALVDNQVKAYKLAQDASPVKKLSADDLGGLEKVARVFNMLRASARQDSKHQQFGALDDKAIEATIAALEAES